MFETEERPAVTLREYLITEAAKATATERTVVHNVNEYSKHVDNGLTITRLGCEEYFKMLHVLPRRLTSVRPSGRR